MELEDLAIFRTVVHEGGILKAARKLHRVPSSVTTRVKQLEASLGTELFYRDRQRLHLSPGGHQLLDYAERLLRLSNEARQAVAGGAPSGVLRIGSLESTTASRLPAVLSAFHRRYPDVRVELSTGPNDALIAALAARRIDAAFVAEAPADKGIVAMPLFRERLVIISPEGHAPVTRPQDVQGDTVVAFANGCAYRRVLMRWLGDKRVATMRVLDLSSYHAIVACVAAGTGIALVPEAVLATFQGPPVMRHRLPAVYADIVTPLIWRAGEVPAALAALHDELRAPARAVARSKPSSRVTGSRPALRSTA
ncbi:MAG TPA: LysR substrate-binding domain-containing protein [Burkholderiaceae bacterium]|nr:LysR substrate-binding domain-containing protein [Burkholderiaceae bacterium]